ncbi:DUF1360 domain-containing protein [Halobacillus fulvus]|nr:DUF1360 domain-containing protein [Halobacillus fulvus]
MTFIELLVLSLASFRFTRLIVDDVIMEWFRKPFFKKTSELNEKGEKEEWIVPNGWIGEGLSCHWCVGIWASGIMLVFYFLIPYGSYLIWLLAIAALQSIFYEWGHRE